MVYGCGRCVCVCLCDSQNIYGSDNGDKMYAYILYGTERSEYEYACSIVNVVLEPMSAWECVCGV